MARHRQIDAAVRGRIYVSSRTSTPLNGVLATEEGSIYGRSLTSVIGHKRTFGPNLRVSSLSRLHGGECVSATRPNCAPGGLSGCCISTVPTQSFLSQKERSHEADAARHADRRRDHRRNGGNRSSSPASTNSDHRRTSSRPGAGHSHDQAVCPDGG